MGGEGQALVGKAAFESQERSIEFEDVPIKFRDWLRTTLVKRLTMERCGSCKKARRSSDWLTTDRISEGQGWSTKLRVDYPFLWRILLEHLEKWFSK